MHEDLPFYDLVENWQRPLDDAMSWFRTQSMKAQDYLKQDLVLSILKVTCDFSNGKEKWNKEESEEFAQFMIDEIKNKARAMSGKKTTVRLLQGILRTALTLYLRLQVGYEEFKENSPECLSSVQTLRMLPLKMRVNDGYNATIYGWFFDKRINSGDRRNSQTSSVCGHLIFEEMKLKTGVCWRSSDHKACGFVSSNSTLMLQLSHDQIHFLFKKRQLVMSKST